MKNSKYNQSSWADEFLQVDVHVGGELVESFTEAEPDTPEAEAPPTLEEEEHDKGKHTFILWLVSKDSLRGRL